MIFINYTAQILCPPHDTIATSTAPLTNWQTRHTAIVKTKRMVSRCQTIRFAAQKVWFRPAKRMVSSDTSQNSSRANTSTIPQNTLFPLPRQQMGCNHTPTLPLHKQTKKWHSAFPENGKHAMPLPNCKRPAA